jgi:hypothetical protein
MRFFSNDAKENTDDDDDRPGHVESDPVAVPQQRAGSPWSDAPGSSDTATQTADSSDSTDGELAGQERRDGTDESLRTDDSEVRHDGDDLVRDPDAPVADAHAEVQPVDLPLDDRHETDDEPASSPDGTTTTYGPDGSVRTVDEPAAADDAAVTDAAASDTTTDDTVADNTATDDTATDDTVTDDTVTDDTVAADAAVADDEPAAAEDAALKDEGEFDSPTVVEPATGETLDTAETTDTVDERETDGATPAAVEEEAIPVAAIPVASASGEDTAKDTDATAATSTGDKPGSVAVPGLDRLFPDGDSFADRFREVQLRFVDSPKEATAEAATLIDEAVDKLAAALKAQKDGLSTDSDDTEQLRVSLRAYRDILNRLTAL